MIWNICYSPPFLYSLPQDVAVLARQQASVILDKILEAHDKRWSIVTQYSETISSFKQKKNKEEFIKTRRSLDDQFKKCSVDIGKLVKELLPIDAEKSAKVRIYRQTNVLSGKILKFDL